MQAWASTNPLQATKEALMKTMSLDSESDVRGDELMTPSKMQELNVTLAKQQESTLCIDKKVPPLSIQLLNISEIDKYFKNEYTKPISSSKERIERIIDKYNKKQRISIRKTEKQKNKPNPSNDVKFELEKKDIWREADYQVLTYSYQMSKLEPLPKQVQKNPQNTQRTYLIMFFYKEDSSKIFAVTCGRKSVSVVRPYVDYSFPVKVIEKTGNPQKIIHIVRQRLFGIRTKECLLQLDPTDLVLLRTPNLYYLVESFLCEVKLGSRLSKLKVFENKPFRINVTTAGIIKICKNMYLRDYPSILNSLAKYMEDNESTEESDPLFEFLHYLQPARPDKTVLDNCLIKTIFSVRENSEDLNSFHIKHKFLYDFLFSEKFELRINSIPRKQTKLPEIEEIIKRIGLNTTIETFTKSVKESQLGFVLGEEIHSEPLLNYIEGEIVFKNNPYFKIRNMFYEVKFDYFTALIEDYRTVLKKSLIKEYDKKNGWLPLPWMGTPEEGNDENSARKDDEGVYNRSYIEIPYDHEKEIGFLVFDKILPEKIEPCDILQYTKDTVYLYHVKEKFGQKTREACSQILNSASLICSALTSIDQPQNYLQRVWDFASGAHKPNPKQEDDPGKNIKRRKNTKVTRASKRKLMPLKTPTKKAKQTTPKKETTPSKLITQFFKVINKPTLEIECSASGTPGVAIDSSISPKKELGTILEEPTLKIECSTSGTSEPEIDSGISPKQELCTILEETEVNTLETNVRTPQKEAHSNDTEQGSQKAREEETAKWRKRVKDRMNEFFNGRAELFLDLFRSNRKIVFVYAHVPEKPERTFSEEIKRETYVTLESLDSVDSTFSLEDKIELLEMLIRLEYLDSFKRLSYTYLSTTKEKFKLDGRFKADNIRTKVYDHLSKYRPIFGSTIGKIELVQLSQNLRKLGYEFKICEIGRGKVDESKVGSSQVMSEFDPIPLLS